MTNLEKIKTGYFARKGQIKSRAGVKFDNLLGCEYLRPGPRSIDFCAILARLKLRTLTLIRPMIDRQGASLARALVKARVRPRAKHDFLHSKNSQETI